MTNMKFGEFVWYTGPEKYQEKCTREPVYVKDEAGATVFSGMSRLRRVITGSGSFVGRNAYNYFKELMAMVNLAEPATLVHPIWGDRSVYLTELTSVMEPRENFVAYTFTFLEADADGTVPQ